MTVPFQGVPLAEHRSWFAEASELGYTDLWSSEADGTDAFTPLALAAAWAPDLRLGTAIVPAYTRGPALLAQSVAAMAEAAPGRFAFGLGTSSDVIVERWNDTAFDRPYQRTRDLVRFLRLALGGERVDEEFETFRVRGFRLGRPPAQVPPILVAALRPGMLRLAGREGDGAIINWLAADDVPRVVAEVGPGREVVARIFVCPSEDTATVRAHARRLIGAYLTVPVYAAFHEWLGRGEALQGLWDGWAAGDRKAAVASIPDAVVDALVLHGSPAAVRAQVDRYVANGVTTPVLALLPMAGVEQRTAMRELAPTAP
ncbi:LLM class F420-dependent oxidoreductase [Acidimicrobiaceae bacterium USS-CC1]|uniref:LLM class F420-dependent oxidoreductase n=1 Tax=Acidiferrimicrobium australe TaxID=2664430 RepID=A0ABW9QV65_9ACTN|nr:LLM class F420-dependent oxidoreductase [Acidiferrimicrobium australe]